MIVETTDWKVRAEILESACRKKDDEIRALGLEVVRLGRELDTVRRERATVSEIHKQLVDALKKAGIT